LHAAFGEPVVGAVPELRCGVALFIGEDLAVGKAGPVVDRGVDVSVADGGSGAVRGLAAAVDLPAAAGWDAGDLLHVDMNQLARTVALIAAHRLGAGGSVAAVETAQAFRTQDRLHC